MAVSSFSSSSSSSALKIGIIGFGTFGQFLAKTMIKQGHILRATSRTDHSKLCHHLGISFFSDVRAFLEADNDVILISTSILSLAEVLESLPWHCLKRPTLIADVLSVKEHPKNVLLQVLPEEMDVLCTHPMFGPESGKDGWKDLAFVYDRVRIRNEATCSSFLLIFESEGCKMLEMSCEEHDKVAAKSQFLTHTIGRILSEMEIQSTSMNTKGFETLVRLVCSWKPTMFFFFSIISATNRSVEVRREAEALTLDYLQKESSVKDSFDLFSGLFIHNRFAKQELQNLELALEKVKHKLLQRMEDQSQYAPKLFC